jgi:hypothetical protein
MLIYAWPEGISLILSHLLQFGWVDSTTTNINTTINAFYSELTGAISSTFQNTVFATPALGVVNCLIGTKIEAVSKALTWLHE